ncbi:pectate lyase family protein [Tabrizicola sp.]|uniref:pectate lyase family protein n=1 Tax=Tabrizicola sp. TaxID=2005166 RepID=UPI003F3C41D5
MTVQCWAGRLARAGLALCAAAPLAIAEPVSDVAFPGAIGFGKSATGWRGGEIVAVTSLADEGPGTLRACAETGGEPRVCVFDVSGTITLDRPILVGSNIYIAGQTAPGQGIQLRNGQSLHAPLVLVNVHDIVVRFLKLRPGPSVTPSSTVDALSIENGSRLYFGNLSLMFATDENFSIQVTRSSVSDITLERSIVALSLNRSTHPDGGHSKGALICSSDGLLNDCGRITLWGNLFAHNRDRNPDVNGTDVGPIEVVNNIFYNPISQFAELYDLTGNLNFVYVGNVALTGPSTTQNAATAIETFDFSPEYSISLVVRDNLAMRRPDCTGTEGLPILTEAATGQVSDDPRKPASVAARRSDEVLDLVPRVAGDRLERGRPPDRLDALVLEDLRLCRGHVIDRIDQVAGWSDLPPAPRRADSDGDGLEDGWEAARGLDAGRRDDAWAIDGQTGLPRIEAYLAELAGDLPPA